ncbi:hypothetical protein TELCIR_12818 [Teladorsagia circumcincta]|uniref:C6 domain-containing protein n=1 Tax=Teladorsagia circumcincta TaxID=45464 RepID=A0A2G9U5Q4_TELCI|nr:hypothetical protein TELCIR_12818 [Teladorsagia circumcincta]
MQPPAVPTPGNAMTAFSIERAQQQATIGQRLCRCRLLQYKSDHKSADNFIHTVTVVHDDEPIPAVLATYRTCRQRSALCGKCKPAKVALIAANGAGTVTPTRKVLTNTAAGCNRMHVICTAPAGATIASMEFNKQFGGGYEAKTVTALLKCNAKQNWIFTKDGVSKWPRTAFVGFKRYVQWFLAASKARPRSQLNEITAPTVPGTPQRANSMVDYDVIDIVEYKIRHSKRLENSFCITDME